MVCLGSTSALYCTALHCNAAVSGLCDAIQVNRPSRVAGCRFLLGFVYICRSVVSDIRDMRDLELYAVGSGVHEMVLPDLNSS